MRLRAGLFLFLFSIILGFGCRKPLTPNVDRNKPPETWITAAPQDTVSTNATPPIVGTISVKFHLYWAGSDDDGTVAGFYYAVVETIPIPQPGLPLPSLPGPKPGDYHFTTKTDSTFVFSVSEFSPDRQHAFFIYAVDNQGKPDPTPARLMFNALDRFPPLPVIPIADGAKATGRITRMLANRTVITKDTTIFIRDSLSVQNFFNPPRDTVPMNSRIDFKWRGEPVVAGSYVAGYRYKFEEPDFVTVDSSVHAVSYNTNVGSDAILAGNKVFTLRAFDQAGGSREINRRFQMNYSPDTWFSGPDPNQPIYQTDPKDHSRYYDVTSWNNLPNFPGSLLSCDSITKLPAERPQRKTFFEFYRNRIYVRSENDTVHLNSWVLVYSGGSDVDSRYDVKINTNDPAIPDTTHCAEPATVLRPGGPNGSPIGFHAQFAILLTPYGFSNPSQSSLYPVFDAASFFRSPVIGGYGELYRAGKAYVITRAEDGDGAVDKRIVNAGQLADRVDAGQGNPAEVKLRSRILTFYVDKAPYLTPDAFPEPGHVFSSRGFTVNLLAADDDPLDPATRPPGTGGPSPTTVLRWKVTLLGKNDGGRDTTFDVTPDASFTPQIPVDVPSYMVGTQITLKVELCDCALCEVVTGSGRCVNYTIPVTIPPPSPGQATSAESTGLPRPGSPNARSRGTKP